MNVEIKDLKSRLLKVTKEKVEALRQVANPTEDMVVNHPMYKNLLN